MTINKLLDERRIKRVTTDLSQIEQWLRQSNADLKLAVELLKRDPRWALTIAYQALLRAGRALMFSAGFLPRSSGTHKTVVEFTQIVFGKDVSPLTRSFERLRRKRHDFFYNILIGIPISEAQKAISDAKKLVREITDKIKKSHRQLRLLP